MKDFVHSSRPIYLNTDTQAFLMIKSQTIAREQVNSILTALTTIYRWNIVAYAHRAPFSKDEVQRFYKEHVGKPYFPDLCASVGGKDGLIGMILQKEYDPIHLDGRLACELLRRDIGATDPRKAEDGTLRSLYGGYRYDDHAPMADNVVHASDAPDAVYRDAKYFFRIENGA